MRTERVQRARELLAALDLDALVVVGVPQVGEGRGAGWLGYLFGYRLHQRLAYGVLARSGDASLVLPRGLRWSSEESLAVAVVYGGGDRIVELVPSGGRLGVLGLGQMLPVADYLALTRAGFELVDVHEDFEELRTLKSAEERKAIASARHICRLGTDALDRSYGAGTTVRELTGELAAVLLREGATATHLLVSVGSEGHSSPFFAMARTVEHVVSPGDVVTFAVEAAGREGYWAETAVTLTDGDPPEELAVAAAARDRFAALATPGGSIAAAHAAVAELARGEGCELGHSLGHGIGLDLIEEPALNGDGMDRFEEGLVFALHPHLVWPGGSAAYVADTFAVGTEGAVPVGSTSMEAAWTGR
jgi:Xaa-Pro aminopeptidase